MRLHDGRNQARETLIDLSAARGVVHLDAASLTTDEAGLAEHFEVLGEGGFGYGMVGDREEGRAVLGALLADDLGHDGDTYRIGECVEQSFDGKVFDCWMEEWLHSYRSCYSVPETSSAIRN